jgi:hypothetical protein
VGDWNVVAWWETQPHTGENERELIRERES